MLLYIRVDIAWYLLLSVDAAKIPLKIVDTTEVPVLMLLVDETKPLRRQVLYWD